MTTIARSARKEKGACASAIWRATEVREKRSRASPDVYKRRASKGGKLTVWLKADDAARLEVRLGCAMACSSRLGRRLRVGVDAVAICFLLAISRV